jgi:hypothetical protein
MLAVIIAIAAGIRLIFWLLEPVAPYLLAALIAFTIFRVISWYRNRW